MSSQFQPLLRTRRLLLRPPEMTDAARLAQLLDDWQVVRMLAVVPWPYEIGHAREWIAGLAGASADSGHGAAQKEIAFILEFGEDGPIGVAGLRPKGPRVYDIGYWLGRDYWRGGLMSEAAARLIAWAFDELGAERLVSGYYVDNLASAALQEKLGFRETGRGLQRSPARDCDVMHVYTELNACEAAKSDDSRPPGAAG